MDFHPDIPTYQSLFEFDFKTIIFGTRLDYYYVSANLSNIFLIREGVKKKKKTFLEIGKISLLFFFYLIKLVKVGIIPLFSDSSPLFENSNLFFFIFFNPSLSL